MNKTNLSIIEKNRKIDEKLIKSVEKLANGLPEIAKPKQGADFRLTPAFGGKPNRLKRTDSRKSCK